VRVVHIDATLVVQERSRIAHRPCSSLKTVASNHTSLHFSAIKDDSELIRDRNHAVKRGGKVLLSPHFCTQDIPAPSKPSGNLRPTRSAVKGQITLGIKTSPSTSLEGAL